MSRNDYISKLFIDNQDKLDEQPSNDLWGRLEARLDEELPVETTTTKTIQGGGRGGSMIKMSRFLAAASILLAVFSVVALYQYADKSNLELGNTSSPAIAMNDAPNEHRTAQLEDDVQPTANGEQTKEQLFKKEDSLQEERILAEVRNLASVKEDEKVVLADIEIVEEVTAPVDVISMSIEEDDFFEKTNTVARAKDHTVTMSMTGATNNRTTNQQEVITTKNTAYKAPSNYAKINAPITNNTSNNQAVDAIIEQNASNANSRQEDIGSSAGGGENTKIAKRRGGVKSRKKADRTSSNPMATANPRLYNFGWLLGGQWVDMQEGDGESRAEWKLQDPNTIVGKGFKVKDGASIFQEKMIIEYRPDLRQVFLMMYVEDNNRMIEYMLADPEPERLIFKQNDYSQFPDQVIIERGIDNYTVIINHNRDLLSPDQQRYLENRNRVSNVRAMRTMKYTED